MLAFTEKKTIHLSRRVKFQIAPSFVYVSGWFRTEEFDGTIEVYGESKRRPDPNELIDYYYEDRSEGSLVLQESPHVWSEFKFVLPVHLNANLVSVALIVRGSRGYVFLDDITMHPAHRKFTLERQQ